MKTSLIYFVTDKCFDKNSSMIETLPVNELSETKSVVVGWICYVLDVRSGYLKVIKAECENVMSQGANTMHNHASYNILAHSSLVCLQTNCKAGELPLDDSVCLLYKYPCTA